MAKSIKGDLLRSGAKIGELEVFLTSYFGSSSQLEDNIVRHGENLEIIYNKKGTKIFDIRILGNVDEKELTKLKLQADEALYSDHGEAVGMGYVFFQKPIKGYFRFFDEFQIIPVPSGAARPEELIADHPAIVEFSYTASAHNLVDSHRREVKRRWLFEVLNTLVINGMVWSSNIATKHWVFRPLDEIFASPSPKLEPIYCQEGYKVDDEWHQKDDRGFSVDPDWPEIETMPENAYYNMLGITITDPFKLPRTICDSLNMVYALAEEDQRAFHRAAHWLKKSSDVFVSSHSLSYCALVYALEGLIEEPVKIGVCEDCGRDIFDKSISKRFRELLERHDANLPKSDVDEIYRIRSAIAHGGGLMPRDREITGFRFNADHNQKNDVFRELQRVCRIVMINWLHSAERTFSTK